MEALYEYVDQFSYLGGVTFYFRVFSEGRTFDRYIVIDSGVLERNRLDTAKRKLEEELRQEGYVRIVDASPT